MSTLARIDELVRIAHDESLPVHDQLDAIDEGLMWLGPFITRQAFIRQFSQRFTLMAGCLADVGTGRCRCDDIGGLIQKALRGPAVWVDAVDVTFTPRHADRRPL